MGVQVAFLVLGGATALTGLVLFRAADRNGDLGGVFLSTLLLLVSFTTLLNAAYNLGAGWIPIERLAAVTPLGVGAIVAFGITYPGLVLELRHQIALAAVGLASMLLSVVLLVDPEALQVFETLLLSSFAIVLALLGLRWLTSPAGEHRTRITWGLIPFVFFALHDGLGFALFPLLMGPESLSDQLGGSTDALKVALGLLLVLGSLALAAIALARVLGGSPARDTKALGFVTLGLVLVSFLQLLDPTVHLLLDFLFVALIVYAVARYNVVDLDLKLKWGLEKSTILGAFGVTFLVVSEAIEALLDVDGLVFGIGAAVLIGLVFRRIERVARGVADRLMPGVEGSSAHLDDRRATIYRAQAESLLADGEASQKERGALDRLREELDLDRDEAERIEAAVLEVA